MPLPFKFDPSEKRMSLLTDKPASTATVQPKEEIAPTAKTYAPIIPKPVAPKTEVEEKPIGISSVTGTAPIEETPLAPFPPTPTTPALPYIPSAQEEQPLQAKTEEEIRLEKTQAAQSQIDALNRYYDVQLRGEEELGEVRERRGAAISTLTGLAGSTEATTAAQAVDEKTRKALEAVNAERGVAIQQILSDIRTSAVDEAKQSRLEARQSAEDVITMRAQRREEAVENVGILAMSGITIEGLAKTDPESYAQLAQSVGGSEILKSMFTLNRPVDSIIDKRVEGGKYIIAYRNPVDGTTRIETVDLGLPEGYSKSIDAGDRLLFLPDNWTGDPNDLISIDKGMTAEDKANLQYKQAQIAKIQAETATTDSEGTDITELDPDSRSILAQTGLSIPAFTFLTTGVKALTRMKSADRKRYMAEAENWAISNNIDTSIFQAEYKAQTDVVETYVKRAAAVDLRGDDIMLSLDMLKNITAEAQFSDLKIKNVAKLWVGKQVNDPVAQQYAYNLEDLRSAVAGFFAVQEGRNMTTVEDGKNAEDLISDGLATGSINGLIETISIVKERTTAISNQASVNAQDRIWDMFGVEKPRGGEEGQNIQQQAEATGFDYNAAVEAGYTDEEIMQFLQ